MDDGIEKSVLFNKTDVIALDHDIDIPGQSLLQQVQFTR